MSDAVTFRPARPEDASDLAVFLDAASRRIMTWYWSTLAAPGQSWSEVGRQRILGETDSHSHYTRWQVAERDGVTIGAFFGFSLPDPYVMEDTTDLEPVFHPFVQMEAAAPGAWMLQAISLHPEWRGQGLGRLLIERACAAAKAAGHARIVLEVESPNTVAIAAYRACGFAELIRLPYVPFPGSDDSGDWILMARDL